MTAVRALLYGLLLLPLLRSSAQADAPAGYYTAAEGKSGPALQAVLHQIVRNHRVVSYADTDTALALLDQAPDDPNAVRLVYSGLNSPKSAFAASTGWNREHLWPKSYNFEEVLPAYSDLHNLRACDLNVNSSRGNTPYDDSDPAAGGYRVPAFAEAPGTSRDSDSWEPREDEKGDIARALFYMHVRYEGNASGEPDLVLTDNLASVASGSPYMGKLTSFLVWHLLDPVSPAEMRRNDLIAGTSLQRNRNPFVDRPEFVTALFGNPLQLAAAQNGGSITLTWSTDLHRVGLEASDDLQSWQAVTQTPVRTGSVKSVTLAMTGPRRFFRLAVK